MLMDFLSLLQRNLVSLSMLRSILLEADLWQGFDCNSLFWGSKCGI